MAKSSHKSKTAESIIVHKCYPMGLLKVSVRSKHCNYIEMGITESTESIFTSNLTKLHIYNCPLEVVALATRERHESPKTFNLSFITDFPYNIGQVTSFSSALGPSTKQ